MQYNNYNITITQNGCTVRDLNGKIIVQTPTEAEAIEYIDDIIKESTWEEVDWYKRFDNYCKKLPGRIYPKRDDLENKICTSFRRPLLSFMESFSRTNSVNIAYFAIDYGGEDLFVVDSVEKY